MKIIRKVSSAYSVINCKNGRYQLVKIIGEYESEKLAYSDILSLFNQMKTEIDLIDD